MSAKATADARRFADVTALLTTGPGRFEADVDPAWTIGGRPNGGYLLSMLARAAASRSPHADVVAASAHYLHAPEPGRVAIEAELLRAGRSASQIRASMSQDGRSCVEALLTLSQLDPAQAPYWGRGLPPISTVAIEDCRRFTPDLSSVAIMEQVEIRLEPRSSGFLRGEPSGRGELRGFLSLPSGEPFDPTSLLFAIDAFPPATFDIEFAGWVPTFELTGYVRARPAPGPLRFLQRAQLIEAQRVDEVCYLWDRRERLVAQGTQLAGVRLG